MVALAILVVIVVVVAGAAAYVLLSSSSPSSTTATSSTPMTTATTSSTPMTTSSAPMTTATSTPSMTSTSSAPMTTASMTPTTTTTTTSTTSLSSFTCTSTFTSVTTTSPAVDYTPQYIGLIAEFSSIQFKITGTNAGTAENETFGYTTSTISSGIYNVTLTISSNPTGGFSFVVDTTNSTVLSANLEGYVVTGTTAKQEFDSIMGLFGLEEYYSGEIGVFTDPSYFTNQGTSTQTFGTVSFPVTTYGLNSANEVINYCGVSATISSYTLAVGTPPGTSLLFITELQFTGTSQGQTENITFQLESMTLQNS